MFKKALICSLVCLVLVCSVALPVFALPVEVPIDEVWGDFDKLTVSDSSGSYWVDPWYKSDSTETGYSTRWYSVKVNAGINTLFSTDVKPSGLTNLFIPKGSSFTLEFSFRGGTYASGMGAKVNTCYIAPMFRDESGNLFKVGEMRYDWTDSGQRPVADFSLVIKAADRDMTLDHIWIAQYYEKTYDENMQIEYAISAIKYDTATFDEQQAQQGGQGAVDDLTGALPTDVSGFITAINNFVGSFSYDGTDCTWKFPGLYLPAIPGVMDRLQLTEEMDIDFAQWIQAIPPNILSIVQILSTIALIIFCGKELYSLVSYVLTMRGGN